MRKTRRSRRKLIKYASFVLFVVFLVSAALVFLKMWEVRRGMFTSENTDKTTVQYNGTEYTLKDSVETFLVLGLDKYEGSGTADSYNNDKQADFLMLFVFDSDAKKYTTINISRDTMANVNILGVAGNKIDSVTKQIALAHTYGNGKDVSCRNTADAVSELLLGMKVNHYASLTMDSVPILNDLVGGVEVTVLDDFTGIDDTLVKGETVTLMGDKALTYVRTRYGLENSSNSTRMERQRQYLDSLREAMHQCIENDDEFIVDASLKMADYIVSDRSVTQLQELVRRIDEYEYVETDKIGGESRSGEEFVEFYPDEDSIKKIVIDWFYKPNA